jgi:hypothetical protein
MTKSDAPVARGLWRRYRDDANLERDFCAVRNASAVSYLQIACLTSRAPGLIRVERPCSSKMNFTLS